MAGRARRGRHPVESRENVGAEIENSVDCSVTRNLFIGNTGGLLVFVGPNLPMPFTQGVRVAHNGFYNNNRTNTGCRCVRW